MANNESIRNELNAVAKHFENVANGTEELYDESDLKKLTAEYNNAISDANLLYDDYKNNKYNTYGSYHQVKLDNLRNRLQTTVSYLKSKKSTIDYSPLEQMVSNLGSASESVGSISKFYSQFKNKKQYDDYVTYSAYDAMSADEAQAEIDRLTKERDGVSSDKKKSTFGIIAQLLGGVAAHADVDPYSTSNHSLTSYSKNAQNVKASNAALKDYDDKINYLNGIITQKVFDEKYGDIAKNADFEDYTSGFANGPIDYSPLENRVLQNEALPQEYASAYNADELYAYINGNDSMRQQYKNAAATATTLTAPDDIADDNNFKVYYDFFEEDEKAIFNYIYNKEGKEKAQEYMDDLKRTITARYTEDAKQDAADYASAHPVLSTVETILESPIQTLGTVLSVISDKVNGREIDPNSAGYEMANRNSQIRSTAQEELEKTALGDIGFDLDKDGKKEINAAGVIYTALTSMGDMAVAMALGAGLSSVFTGAATAASSTASIFAKIKSLTTSNAFVQMIMSGSAATQSILDKKNAGASDGEALTSGIISGLAEWLTEKYSPEKFFGDPKSVFMQLTKSFVSEGLEEVNSDILNNIADLFIYGNQSEMIDNYYSYMKDGDSEQESFTKVLDGLLADSVNSFASGALAGLGMGGGAAVANTVKNVNTGRGIRKSGSAGELIDNAKNLEGYADNTYLQKITEKAQNRQAANKNISAYSLGKLANESYQQESRDIYTSAVSERLVQLGVDDSTAKTISGALYKESIGEELTKTEKQTLKAISGANQNASAAQKVIDGLSAAEYAAYRSVLSELQESDNTSLKESEIKSMLLSATNNENAAFSGSMDSKTAASVAEVISKQLSGGEKISSLSKAVNTVRSELLNQNIGSEAENFNNPVKNIANKSLETAGKYREYSSSEANVKNAVVTDNSGTSARIDSVTGIKDGKATVLLSDGRTAVISSKSRNENTVTFRNTNAEVLFTAAAMMPNAEAANEMIQGYQRGTNASDYVNEYLRFFNAGKSGIDMDNLVKSKSLSKENRAKAYDSGSGDIENRTAVLGDGTVIKGSKNLSDVITDIHEGVNALYSESGKNNAKMLSQTEAILDYFGKKHGVKFVLVDSIGAKQGKANGMHKNGVIYIALNSDTPLLTAAGHEMFHYLKQNSSVQAQALQDFVIDKLKSDTRYDYDEQFKNLVDLYGTDDVDYIHEEMAANAMFDVLAREENVRQLAKENKSLAKKVFSRIKKFIEAFKAAVGNIQQREAVVLRNQLDTLKEIYDRFDKALQELDTNKNTADVGGEMRYSLNNVPGQDELNSNIIAVSKMSPVVKLIGNEFSKGDTNLIEQVTEYFNSIGNQVTNTYGVIELQKKGIKSSIGHGIGRIKAVAFKAVPDILKQGKIVDYQINWKNRGYDTAVFAAPIMIGSNEYYAAAVVVVEKAKNSYYLHEVAIEKKEDNAMFKTGTVQNGTSGKALSPLQIILQKISSVKSQYMQDSGKVLQELDTNKNTADAGGVEKIRYSLMNNKSFTENVNDIMQMSDEEAQTAKSEGHYIRISENTSNVILNNISDAKNLPVIIRFDALYLAAKHDGVLLGHYHDFGSEIADVLPKVLNDPDAILRLENGRINLLTSVNHRKGKNGIVSVELNTVKDINSSYNMYNMVISLLPAKDNYTKNLIKKSVSIEYIKKDLSQVNPQLYEWLSIFNEKSSDNNISQSNTAVNSQYMQGEKKDTEKFSFAGRNANTADTSSLDEAIRLSESGEMLLEEIRRQTGWFKGYDGKWRFELDDSDMDINIDAIKNVPYEHYTKILRKKNAGAGQINDAAMDLLRILIATESEYVKILKLDSFVKHDKLFKAYPQIADYNVVISKNHAKASDTNRVAFDSDYIIINRYVDQQGLKKTLAHEIQHIIQKIEDFAMGADEQMIYRKINSLINTIETGVGNVEQAEKELHNMLNFNISVNTLIKVLNQTDMRDELLKFAAHQRYLETAGEVEARDTANRLVLDSEKRKESRPDIDRNDVVFADYGTDEKIRYSIKEEVDSYNLGSLNDYIGVQKRVLKQLDSENFFSDNGERIVYNKDFGSNIIINKSGIRETLGKGNRFETLPSKLKQLKLATIRQLPQIIESAVVYKDRTADYHKNNPDLSYSYLKSTVSIDGESYDVIVDIRKSREKDKFWMHRIYEINKNEQPFGVAESKDSKTTLSKVTAHDDTIPQSKNDVKGKFSLQENQELIEAHDELLKENEAYAQAHSLLREMVTLTRGRSISQTAKNNTEKYIDKLLDKGNMDYGSKSEIKERIMNILHSLSYTQIDTSDAVNAMAAVCADIVRNSYVEIEDGLDDVRDMVKNLRRDIRSVKIHLNEEQYKHLIEEYGSLTKAKKAFYSGFNIVKKVTTDSVNIDYIWSELIDKYAGLFSENDTELDSVHMIQRLNELMQTVPRKYASIAEAGTSVPIGDIITELSYDIFGAYMNNIGLEMADYRKLLAKAKQKQKDIRAYKNIQLDEQREYFSQQRKRASESRETSTLKGQIQRIANNINKMLTNPAKGKYVPKELAGLVTNMAEVLNNSYNAEGTQRYDERIKNLRDKLTDAQATAENPGVIRKIQEINEAFNKITREYNKTLRRLSERISNAQFRKDLEALHKYQQQLSEENNRYFEEKRKRNKDLSHWLTRRDNINKTFTDEEIDKIKKDLAKTEKGKRLFEEHQQELAEYFKNHRALSDTEQTEAFFKQMQELETKYAALSKHSDEFIFVYNKVTHDLISSAAEFLEKHKGAPISELGSEKLQVIKNAMSSLHKQITSASKFLADEKGRDAFEVGRRMERETNQVTEKKSRIAVILNKYNLSMLDARRAFRMFGGYAKNSAWEEVFDYLNDAQRKQLKIQMEGEEIFRDVLSDENFKNASNLRSTSKKRMVDIGLVDESGNAVQITRGMMLAIYMHLQNEANTEHLRKGGLTVPNMQNHYSSKSESYGRGSVEVKSIDVVAVAQNIEKLLTDYDRKFIAAAKTFFDVYSSKVLNEATMEMYGFEKANVKNYFPIRTDSAFIKSEFESVKMDFAIENAGFMKDRIQGASNPILLEDITDVVTMQIDRTARYAAIAPAMMSFSKVYNTAESGFQGSLKRTVVKKLGSEAASYIDKLIGDMNGNNKGESSFIDKFRSRFAGTVLTGNVSVMMKQAASYVCAAPVVGWDNLIQGLFTPSRTDTALIMKYTPLLWYRTKGNSTQEIQDLKNSKLSRALSSNKVLNKTVAKFVNGIQEIDLWTVKRIWHAAEKSVQKNSEFEKGSENYYKQVAEVFNRAVEQTQPDYTVLQRPEILRSKNAITKSLTMFMTQRLQNFGIVYDAAMDLNAQLKRKDQAEIERAKKAFASAVASQLLSAVTISAMSFAASAMLRNMGAYRDEDDELTKESIAKELGNDFFETLAGMFIGGSELYAVISAAINKRSFDGIDVAGVQQFTDTINDMLAIWKHLTDDPPETDKEKEKYKEKLKTKIWNAVFSASQLVGIPANNMYRIGRSWILGIEDAKNGEPFSYESSVDRSASVQYNRLFKALQDGDTEKYNKVYDEIIESGKTPEQIQSKLKSMLIETDENIMNAVSEYINGGVDDFTSYVDGLEKDGYDRNTAADAVKSVYSKVKTAAQAKIDGDSEKYDTVFEELVLMGYDESKLTSDIEKIIVFAKEENTNGYESIYDKQDLATAYFNNKSMYDTILKDLEKAGKKTDITDNVKKMYQFGSITKAQAEKYLADVKELDADEIYYKFEEWAYSGEGSYSKYNDFDSAADAFITGSGNAISAWDYAKELMQHGVEKSDIAKRLTSNYKKRYIEIYYKSRSDTITMKNRLLTLYQALGYDWDYESGLIDKWITSYEKEQAENK